MKAINPTQVGSTKSGTTQLPSAGYPATFTSPCQYDRDAMNQLDEIVEQFQDQWTPAGRGSFDDFLPDTQPLRFAALATLVSVDLELSLRSGIDIRPDKYLEEYPELTLCREIASQLFTKCFKLRAETDTQLSWKEYLQSVPIEWQDELQSPVRYLRTNELLGRGGQAAVWRSEDQELGRTVALKVFHPDRHNEKSRQRFIAEARVIGDLEHPSIVPVYGWEVTVDGRIAYAMQLLEWPTLSEQIASWHATSPQSVRPEDESFRKLLSHFQAVCNAVAFAHDRGYLHLDLKPGNILVGDYGETMVMDWGLTQRAGTGRPLNASISNANQTGATGVNEDRGNADRAFTSELQSTIDWYGDPTPSDSIRHETGQIAGTLAYMSPEQARGEPDDFSAATDVFGLGAVLYQILLNRPPYSRRTAEGNDVADEEPIDSYIKRVEACAPPSPRNLQAFIPRSLDAVCRKAMSRDPGERYQSAKLLAAEIERWLADEPVNAYSENRAEKFWRWMRRHHRQVFTSSILMLVVITLTLAVRAVIQFKVRQTEVNGVINSLIQAEPDNIPSILSEVADDELALTELRRKLEDAVNSSDSDMESVQRFRLAILESDPSQLQPLLDDALQIYSDRELVIVRDIAAKQAEQIDVMPPPSWWKALEQGHAPATDIFRAAALLAAFDSTATNWSRHADRLARELLELSPSEAAFWTPTLSPVREFLLPELQKSFSDNQQPLAKRLLAADIMSSYLANRTAKLIKLLLDADPQQHGIVFSRLSAKPAESLRLLKSNCWDVNSRLINAREPIDRIKESQHLTRLQAALLRFGPEQFDWHLLESGSEPTLRTELIHFLPQCQVSAEVLLNAFQETENPGIRAAILLCLGGYQNARHGIEKQGEWAEQLQLSRITDTTSDPELRAAAMWLKQKLQGHNNAEPTRVDRVIDRDKLSWYVTVMNRHSMITIPQSVLGDQVAIGTINELTDIQGLSLRETPHKRRIDRDFAIAQCETTINQYEAFLVDYHRDNPNMPFPIDEWIDEDRRKAFALQGSGPAVYVNWLQAATYCNWLSRKEGLEPVYPANVESMAFLPNLPGIEPFSEFELSPTLLKRNGYRLPTEPEWEVACRAGTTTPWHFGFNRNRLRDFAQYRSSDGVAPLAVAQLKPNAWGVFDMLGNAMEWCHFAADYPEEREETVLDDHPESTDEIAVRGGSCQNLPIFVRSSYRLRQNALTSAIDIGFRVARTIPPGDPLGKGQSSGPDQLSEN